MTKKATVITVTLSLIFLMFIAVAAGAFLAIWDMDISIAECYMLAFPVDDAVPADTIVIQDAQFTGPDVDAEHDIKGTADSSSEKLVINIKDAKDPMNPEEDTEGAGAGTANAGADSVSGTEGASENGDTEVSRGEVTAEQNMSDAAADMQTHKPLKITSEISGIATVVRAGDEEDVVHNELPVPTQLTEVNTNIDPTADYPLPMGEVDISYFDDALFIGDSRVAGLAMNSGTNATFYAVTSFQLYKYKTFKVVQTPNGKVPIFDVMPYDKFTKIYIKVGLNELGTVTDEPFIEAYTSLINDLRIMQPRAIIYIQGILPVTQVKSQTDRVHCNEKITARNENLKSFAELMKCYYVDVGPYFADETGALKAETTADGIHMYSKYMPQWIEALRQNAVVWPPVSQ